MNQKELKRSKAVQKMTRRRPNTASETSKKKMEMGANTIFSTHFDAFTILTRAKAQPQKFSRFFTQHNQFFHTKL